MYQWAMISHSFQIFFHKCLLSDLKLFFGICCLIAQQSGYTNVWHTRCLSFSIPTLALSKSGHRSKRFSFLSACLIRKLPCLHLLYSVLPPLQSLFSLQFDLDLVFFHPVIDLQHICNHLRSCHQLSVPRFSVILRRI